MPTRGLCGVGDTGQDVLDLASDRSLFNDTLTLKFPTPGVGLLPLGEAELLGDGVVVQAFAVRLQHGDNAFERRPLSFSIRPTVKGGAAPTARTVLARPDTRKSGLHRTC